MNKLYINPAAGSIAMQKKAIPFDSAVIVPNCARKVMPADVDFQKSGLELMPCTCLFDLEEYVHETRSAMLRFEFTAPADGCYLLGLSADWWYMAWVDGKEVMNLDDKGNGFWPPRIQKRMAETTLAAGKHTIDVRFTRGVSSALLAIAVASKEAGTDIDKDLAAETEANVKARKSVLNPFKWKQDYMEARIKSGIEANRKGNLNLTFVDEANIQVTHAHVKIRQKTHDFKYGANLFMMEEFNKKEQNDAYKKYFADAFNIATLPFYWSDLEPEQGKPRYAKDSPKIYRRPAPDLCLEYCKANGIEPKAHCLNYPSFQPPWAKGSIAWEKQCLRKRFESLAEHYADRIPMWEVTNETFWGHDMFRGSNFYYEPDYVEWSFKEAERCFPANRLVINEAHCNIWDDKSFKRDRSAYYMQIERALLKGCRIDEIGMQYHMFMPREKEIDDTRCFYDPKRIYDVLDTYGKLGLPIHITELTIPAYSYQPGDEELQAEIIRNIYSMWFSHASMSGIIYWNLIDGFAAFAPQGDMTSGENYYHGGLIRYDFTPKPAYKMIQNLFRKEWHTELEFDLDGSNEKSIRAFYGKYDVEVSYGGKTVTKEVHLSRELSHDYCLTV